MCTVHVGGYDSEISDDESGKENGSTSDDETGSSDNDSDYAERRRRDFSKKQRDRLKQVELEERQAMGKCEHKLKIL